MDALHGVEDDVEKKRHMKNPWKESYQSLLSSSFGPSSDMAPASTQERQRSVDLQHEISESSLNVQVRLELLQRQIDDLAKASTNMDSLLGKNPMKRAPRSSGGQHESTVEQDVEPDDARLINALAVMVERIGTHPDHAQDVQLASWQQALHIPSIDWGQCQGLALEDARFERSKPFAECFEEVPETHDMDERAFFVKCLKSIKPFVMDDFVQINDSLDDDTADDPMGSMEIEYDMPEPLDADDAQPLDLDAPMADDPQPFSDRNMTDDNGLPRDDGIEDISDIEDSRQHIDPTARASARPASLVFEPAPEPNSPSQPRTDGVDPIEGPGANDSSLQANILRAFQLAKDASQRKPNALKHTKRATPEQFRKPLLHFFSSAKAHASDVTNPILPTPICLPKSIRDLPSTSFVLETSGSLGQLQSQLLVQFPIPATVQTTFTCPWMLCESAEHDAGCDDDMGGGDAGEDPLLVMSAEAESPVRASFSVITVATLSVTSARPRSSSSSLIEPSSKRLRTAARPSRPLSLKMVMELVTTEVEKSASTTQTSFLSSILESFEGQVTPQRAFVALVFLASRSNDNDFHLKVTSMRNYSDVKIQLGHV